MTVEVRLPADLPDARAAYDHAVALGRTAGERLAQGGVTVRVHRNRSTLLRWRTAPDRLELHVHHAFLPHLEDVLAVVERRDAAAWQRLRSLERGERPAPALASQGAAHDLIALAAVESQRVTTACGGTPVAATVGWGRFGAAPARSLRLGSCQAGPPPVIRVHPVLDDTSVPDWFVGFILYHEYLHLRYPPYVEAGRRVVHPRSFRQAERRHPHYEAALAWEKVHIRTLLARARAARG